MDSDADQSSADITVNIDLQCEIVGFHAEKLITMLSGTCENFGFTNAEINLEVADSGTIKDIHNRFLGSSKDTDVVSFDSSEQAQELRIFDIIINAQVAELQSQKRGIAAESELALYALHGLLHNLGFDDIDEDDAKKMHLVEDEILQSFGYGITYNS